MKFKINIFLNYILLIIFSTLIIEPLSKKAKAEVRLLTPSEYNNMICKGGDKYSDYMKYQEGCFKTKAEICNANLYDHIKVEEDCDVDTTGKPWLLPRVVKDVKYYMEGGIKYYQNGNNYDANLYLSKVIKLVSDAKYQEKNLTEDMRFSYAVKAIYYRGLNNTSITDIKYLYNEKFSDEELQEIIGVKSDNLLYLIGRFHSGMMFPPERKAGLKYLDSAILSNPNVSEYYEYRAAIKSSLWQADKSISGICSDVTNAISLGLSPREKRHRFLFSLVDGNVGPINSFQKKHCSGNSKYRDLRNL